MWRGRCTGGLEDPRNSSQVHINPRKLKDPIQKCLTDKFLHSYGQTLPCRSYPCSLGRGHCLHTLKKKAEVEFSKPDAHGHHGTYQCQGQLVAGPGGVLQKCHMSWLGSLPVGQIVQEKKN